MVAIDFDNIAAVDHIVEVEDTDLYKEGICVLHDRWNKSLNVGKLLKTHVLAVLKWISSVKAMNLSIAFILIIYYDIVHIVENILNHIKISVKPA